MPLTFLLFFSIVQVSIFGSDDKSWKLPLSEKERILEQNNVERHNILGLYPSMVEVPLNGGPVDQTTLGNNNIAHAVCWTANYLAGSSFRYAFLKKTGAPAETLQKAKARADELFEAVYRCQLVTGVRGLQARGYALGHGESYEERGIERLNDSWQQGAGEFVHLRWRGDPSHHNYSDAAAGLGAYYDLAAEGEQKDRCREAIDALVGYWVDNDFRIIHIDGKKFTPILGFHDGKTLNMRIMMAIAGAKTAYHATQHPKYQKTYEQLLDQFGVRQIKLFQTEKDFDDAEHVLCHLENLFRIERDPELCAAYRVILDGIWANHVNDAQTLFTYIYYSIATDAPGKEKAFQEALFTLQTWPTCMIFKPTMSSLNPNLKPPYPMYAAAWDNEYIWKGNLLRPDGWLSRIVMGVAVPREDAMVIYAFDTQGDLYQSRDGASSDSGWRCISEKLVSPVRAVAAGPKVRMIFAACEDGFYASMTGGYTWTRLNVPKTNDVPLGVRVVPGEPNTLYALYKNSAYRNHFRSDRDLDRKWEPTSPPKITAQKNILFRPDPKGVLKSEDGGKTWLLKSAGLRIPQAITVFDPENTNWIFAGTPAGLFVSKDWGETWEDAYLVLQFIRGERRDLGGAAFIDAYWRGRYYGFISDEQANQSIP